MIRIGYMSDLHLEFEEKGPRAPTGAWFALRKQRRELSTEGHPLVGPLLDGLKGKIDLMVIAGDVATPKMRVKGRSSVHYAQAVAEYVGVPVVLIAGNHEFYDGDIETEITELRAEAVETRGQVQFLERETASFTFGEERLHVLGCTLWTDFALFGEVEAASLAASEGMNDFRDIRYGRELFRTSKAAELHELSKTWLGEEIAQLRDTNPQAKLLVVSHHAPSPDSLPKKKSQDILTAAYASDLISEITSWQPDMWLHGHIHDGCDSQILGTKVVSAARGYIGHGQNAEIFSPSVITI